MSHIEYISHKDEKGGPGGGELSTSLHNVRKKLLEITIWVVDLIFVHKFNSDDEPYIPKLIIKP